MALALLHPRTKDLTGQTFARLRVLEPGPSTKGRQAQWYCQCMCGTRVLVSGAELRKGHSRSCGCLQRDTVRTLNYTHGQSKSPEYLAWKAIKGRCHNPRNASYHKYGARGIYVCEAWRTSFDTFLRDMGPRPSPQHSIDRYPDNNGPYAPDNTRWATVHQQARNKRTTRLLTINGMTQCLQDWLAIYPIKGPTFHARIRLGWTPEDALTTPVHVHTKASFH